MKKWGRIALMSAITLFLVFIVRTFALAIYVIPVSYLGSGVNKGDIVMVNKLFSVPLKKGDVVVFCREKEYVGRISAVPGDTVTIQNMQYIVPLKSKCPCNNCSRNGYFLIEIDNKKYLVCRCDITGKTHKIFRIRI